MEIFNLSFYYFYKVIEIIIRIEEGFLRDVVKYFNYVSFKRLFDKNFRIEYRKGKWLLVLVYF